MKQALQTLLGWPRRERLAAVWGRRQARFAVPKAVFRVRRDAPLGLRSEWLGGAAPVPLLHEPLRDLAAVLQWGRSTNPSPGRAGWVGMLSYDLGRLLEPAVERAGGGAATDRSWPLIELAWCPDPITIDRHPGDSTTTPPPTFSLGPLQPRTSRATFEASVQRAIDYIRAGDVFQVNLAHRLSATFDGSTRSLFAALCATADPWHGGYLEMSDVGCRMSDVEPDGRGASDIHFARDTPRAVVSCSPELFLHVERAGFRWRVVTRPMKGTRPASVDPSELGASPKDRAELNMIIDLMRNDLGRVCRAGSVRVERPRDIERHGGAAGVWQATATVGGELRGGVGPAELLGATFPAGSVTGAPKIRAMQIIDELEPVRRGPYCGAVGWIGADGSMELSVGIRTALVSGIPGDGPGETRAGTLDYSVGAGIVADSDPAAEWRETMDKAGVIRSLASRADHAGDEGSPGFRSRGATVG